MGIYSMRISLCDERDITNREMILIKHKLKHNPIYVYAELYYDDVRYYGLR
jgi:hypothetical protein